MNEPVRILIVGSLSRVAIGGTMVSLRYLVEGLRGRSDVDLRVIDTGGIRGCGLGGAVRFLTVVFRLFYDLPRSQVVGVHLACTAIPVLSPLLIPLTRLFHCPVHARVFGGIGWGHRKDFKWLMAYDGVLLQTKALCDEASKAGLQRVEWFPTSRPMPPSECLEAALNEAPPYRLLFVGTVKTEKGVGYLLELMKRLRLPASLDLYGPVSDINLGELEVFENISYKGYIDPVDVHLLMRDYDLLLLPTFHPDEGYPGVIIEAFAAGLPVVTTRWRQIPELAEGAAFLIPPHDVEALHDTVEALLKNAQERKVLREAGCQRARELSSEVWTQFYLDYCQLQAR